MKLVVIGTGLTGSKLVRKGLEKGFKVTGTYCTQSKELNCKQLKLDKSDKGSTFDLIEEEEPDVVVDTAAMHNVDECEKNPEISKSINVRGNRYVAEACEEFGSSLVFLSTDYVFDGKSDKPYTEVDHPNPLSVYGRHKLRAERIVLNTVRESIVVRPSVIYGWDPVKDNFVTWALKELRNGNEINIVEDQYSNPTLADDLADTLLRLIIKGEKGLFHVAGRSCLNRYQFTQKIADVFNLDKDLIKPISTEELGQVAPRPMKGCLSVKKVEKTLHKKMLTAEEGLRTMKNTE